MIGRPAPDFSLPSTAGENISLKQFKGKKTVVLYFYPKDETPGCTREACDFRDHAEELESARVVVLGVSTDSLESHQHFKEKNRLPFPLLSDPDRTVMAKYGAFGEKTMYGKTVQGVIRSTVWIGPDGKVRRHWARVAKAETHPEAVLAAVREAL